MLIVGDLNLLLFWFFLILLNVFLNANNTLNLLLTAELLWITLYLIVLMIGMIYDNINLLSLSFFFLIFSAIELSVGLILLLLQNLLTRSSYLNSNDLNFNKFQTKFFTKNFLNKINWKI